MKPVLVVGAGFSGATIARELAEANYKVVVIDKRNHVAGNAYDTEMHGFRMHQYGPHLFHTSSRAAFEYLSRFTKWLSYKHKVKALLDDGRYVTLPVNKETKDIVGEDKVLDIFFRPYSLKMWGVTLDELNPSIANRVPIRNDMNEYYFPNDDFQFLPIDGYTRLVENMLDHKNIEVITSVDFDYIAASCTNNYYHIFNSMPIDGFYAYQFGKLPYRSIKFEHKLLAIPQALPAATVNFTHDGPHTRVTEWKRLPGHNIYDNKYNTLLTFEEPCDYADNNFERYYPVKDLAGENRKLYQKYKDHHDSLNANMTFIGRCGLYAYLDMDQAVNSASATAKRFLINDNSR